MKEKLTKFSRGVFQYEKQTLLFSQESIKVSVESGEIYNGSLTVFTRDHIQVKGILSKTDHFLKLSETSFSGTEVTIPYAYDATELPAGETRTGSIMIISNCGEYKIPFVIKIEVPCFDTEYGKIRDLFQFANLAKQDWLCAVKLFKSDQFAKKLLYHDAKNQVLYHSLIKSTSSSHGMEEFLISIHKKMRINLTLDKTAIEYTNVSESLEDRIVIYKDNWGYTEIHVRTDADFMELEHKIIWSENFIGNSYPLKFLIKKEKLKPGRNKAFIYVTTPHQRLQVEILVHGEEVRENQSKNVKARITHQENLVTVTQNYLNFRMNRIAAEEYLNEMRSLLCRMYEAEEKEEYYFLKTHLAVSEGNSGEIEECFEYLEKKKEQWKEEDAVAYAAYKYLVAMRERKTEQIEEASEMIENLYQMEPGNWKLLWLLMNVKKEYMEDARARFAAIQDILKRGVRSSIMYYEASILYREYPIFLGEISEEAIPVMVWMVRENFMTEDMKQQFLMMASKRKHFYPVLYHSLENMYDETEDIEVLQVILSMLVRAQKAGKQYFRWYALGVQNQIRILKLYEYYMYSMEEDMNCVLPESVLTYFSLNCTLHEKKKAFLYANIIQNWEKYDKSLLERYKHAIHEFAKKELEKRVISQNLAILYEELCTSNEFDEQVKANLPYVMFRQELRVDHPDIIGVAVVHQETEGEVYTPIEDGIAQVSIYTDTAQVFLIDRKNNRYTSTIAYYLTKYLSLNELALECLPFAEQNGMLLLYLYEQMETYQNYTQAAVLLRKRLLLLEELKPVFHWKCYAKLINHYYDTSQVALLDELLASVDYTQMETEARVRVMELCMIRGIYTGLEEQLERYGYENLSAKRLLAYCCRQLSQNPERELTPVFLAICYFALQKGKMAKQTIGVLSKHYIGELTGLIEIWKAAKEFEIDCKELEEQIVCQSLFSETNRPEIIQVFYEYNKREDKDKMVVRAYLSYRAYSYLLKEEEVEASLKAEMKRFTHENNCNIVNLAYLKLLSQKEKLTEEEAEYAEIQVQHFVKQNISLSYFQAFKKYFLLPCEIANKYFIEYHCNADRKVILHYALNSEHFTQSVMKNCFQGMFVSTLVLFHGDKLTYYITEHCDDYEKRTEITTIIYEDDMSELDSEYSLLNALLIAKEMQDSSTVLELMKQYMSAKTIISEQFKML